MRPVVIILLDPTSDAGTRFFHAAIFRRPDFLFLQAAMEPFDVAVALRVMVGGPSVRDAQPVERLDEPRRSDLCPIVGGQRQESLTAALGQPRQHGLLHRDQRVFGPAAMGEIPAHDLSRAAVDHAHQISPAHGRPRPDLGHVRLPDLIRLGCFHAAPLFLPSCAQTTRAHQPSAFLASPVTPAPDSRSTLSSAAATTPRADSRMPASHTITICSSAETPRKARPGLGRITVNTVLSVNECSLTCMSIDEDAPMAVDVLAMG